MHWTTHIITGAAIGLIIGRPLPAAVAGVASHVALDASPHYDPDNDLSYVIDSAIGAVILARMTHSARLRRIDPRHASIAGALGAGLPDLEHLVTLFKYVPDEDYLFPTHNGTIEHRQTGVTQSNVSQAGICLVLLLAATLAVRRRLRRRAESGARAG